MLLTLRNTSLSRKQYGMLGALDAVQVHPFDRHLFSSPPSGIQSILTASSGVGTTANLTVEM